MCRLYGFHANEATKVECTLVHAQNALLIQSRGDLRGVAHADGWGIACYSAQTLDVQRCATAAHADLQFSAAAERIFAETVVAHVRRATVGVPSVSNTHPFRYGRWVFAHNGTITGFDELRERLAHETKPFLQACRLGTTDSEQAFYWLLSRMVDAGVDLSEWEATVDRIVDVVGEAVRELAARCDHAEKEPKLNFLLTDGRCLVASRWGNTLYWVSRDGVHDCEICGIPHVHHQPQRAYRAVVVASEPISHEAWQPLANRGLLAVGPALAVRTYSL